MAKHVDKVELTPAQEAEAQRIEQVLLETSKQEVRELARLMASKQDHEILGETEYQVRDIVHRLGAKALETAANERAKKGVPR
jgi:hypothetical protein